MFYVSDVIKALHGFRLTRRPRSEADLSDQLADLLLADGLPVAREYRLGPNARLDLAVPTGGVGSPIMGVEVKLGRPDPTALARQLRRYAAHDLAALVVEAERCPVLPPEIDGVPVRGLSINAREGVAV